MKKPIIEQLKEFTKNVNNQRNLLSKEEKETLLLLIRKCASPTEEYCNASGEEETDESRIFVNTIDDDFAESSAEFLSTLCTGIASTMGGLIADELVKMVKDEGLDEPTDEMVNEAIEAANTNNGLPPSFLQKPSIIGTFLIQSIEDPLVAMLQSNKCLEVGERVCKDAIKMSAMKMRLALS